MKKYNLSTIMSNAWALRRRENITMSIALKWAWTNAKEATKMENEIKALIDKYSLVRRGDQIGTYNTKGIDRAAFMREVGPRKAEIMAYFKAQEQAAANLRAKWAANFESIPGVVELRTARAQRAEWQQAFNRMMTTGSSKMPAIEAPTPDELAAMEANYPMAVFALEAQSRVNSTQNDQLRSIWSATYDALCDGQDPETVKADHDARMAQFTADNRWN